MLSRFIIPLPASTSQNKSGISTGCLMIGSEVKYTMGPRIPNVHRLFISHNSKSSIRESSIFTESKNASLLLKTHGHQPKPSSDRSYSKIVLGKLKIQSRIFIFTSGTWYGSILSSNSTRTVLLILSLGYKIAEHEWVGSNPVQIFLPVKTLDDTWSCCMTLHSSHVHHFHFGNWQITSSFSLFGERT